MTAERKQALTKIAEAAHKQLLNFAPDEQVIIMDELRAKLKGNNTTQLTTLDAKHKELTEQLAKVQEEAKMIAEANDKI